MVNIPDLEGLFQGAARLGLLAAARQVDWPRTTPYVRAFSLWLNGYQEISLDLAEQDLGLMTRGSGQDFTYAVTRFMELAGVPEPRLRRLLVTGDFFRHRNLFFKLELGPDGGQEMSWYFRRRPDLATARAWLEADGVAAGDLDTWQAIAGDLGKRTVHFLGSAEAPGADRSHQKVYLSQPEGTSWDRLLAAGERLGLSRGDWAPLLDFRGALEGHTCFLSVDFVDGRLQPGAKLDIHRVPPEVAHALGRASQKVIDQGAMLRDLFDRRRYDYAGVRLAPGAMPAVKVYCYRQGKLPEAPE